MQVFLLDALIVTPTMLRCLTNR